MSKNTVQLRGAKELEKNLRTLGERVQRKVARQAINAAATPVVKAARGKVAEESGTLKKSLGKKVKTYKETQTVAAIVGPRTDAVGEFNGKIRRPRNYAHLVEGGHVDENGNTVPPQPFLRPAFEETKYQALNVLSEKLSDGIAREAAKGGTK